MASHTDDFDLAGSRPSRARFSIDLLQPPLRSVPLNLDGIAYTLGLSRGTRFRPQGFGVQWVEREAMLCISQFPLGSSGLWMKTHAADGKRLSVCSVQPGEEDTIYGWPIHAVSWPWW